MVALDDNAVFWKADAQSQTLMTLLQMCSSVGLVDLCDTEGNCSSAFV